MSGRAIVRVLEDLPFAVTWVDTSAGRFPERIPPHATAEIAPDPAAFAGGAAADAFHLVLTYSHALDLAICHSLLRRGDFRFLGLIGSATKRARFLKRLAELGIGEAPAHASRLPDRRARHRRQGAGDDRRVGCCTARTARHSRRGRAPAQAFRQEDAAP